MARPAFQSIVSPAWFRPTMPRAPTRVRVLGYQRTSAMGSSRTAATCGQSAALTERRASARRCLTDSPFLYRVTSYVVGVSTAPRPLGWSMLNS